MRRVAVAAVAVLLSLSLTAGESVACEPGEGEGWVSGALAGVYPENALYLEPTIDGHYEGIGYWKLVIKRGKGKKAKKIVINSPENGAPAFGPPGSIKAGDKVTGYFYEPFSLMMFGNIGCVPYPEAMTVTPLVTKGGRG